MTEKEKLYRNVDLIRSSFGLSLDTPINIITLLSTLKKYDIDFHNFKTPGLCGIAMVGDKTDSIILNSNRSPTEQNFDCAHELIHLSIHRHIQDNFNCFAKAKPKQNTFYEWQANEGAAQFLVPYQDFIPRFLSCRLHSICNIQEILANYYHVSEYVISIRINNLSYEIDQYSEGVPLEDIKLLSRKQREKEGIRTTCYSAVCDFYSVVK